MTAQIGQEVQLLLVSVYAGIILGVSYDLIRVFRRVKPASLIRSFLEDLIFWTVASIYLFHVFLKYNYGTPRYYGVGMMVCTMFLYEWLWGKRLVPWVSKTIRRILLILLKPLKKYLNGFKLLSRKVKNRLLKLVKGEKNDV